MGKKAHFTKDINELSHGDKATDGQKAIYSRYKLDE